MKVVLDTNVLISAIVFGGNPRKILEAILNGEPKLFFSENILDELKGVLQRPKFGFQAEVIQAILSELNAIGHLIKPLSHVREIQEDADDNRILECAIEVSANYIISGDTHLLSLKKYRNIRVVSPAEYLKIISETVK